MPTTPPVRARSGSLTPSPPALPQARPSQPLAQRQQSQVDEEAPSPLPPDKKEELMQQVVAAGKKLSTKVAQTPPKKEVAKTAHKKASGPKQEQATSSNSNTTPSSMNSMQSAVKALAASRQGPSGASVQRKPSTKQLEPPAKVDGNAEGDEEYEEDGIVFSEEEDTGKPKATTKAKSKAKAKAKAKGETAVSSGKSVMKKPATAAKKSTTKTESQEDDDDGKKDP